MLGLILIGSLATAQQTRAQSTVDRNTAPSIPDRAIGIAGTDSLAFTYVYEGKMPVDTIADSAGAIERSKVVGKAWVRNIHNVGGTTHIAVEEAHFEGPGGSESYRGVLLFSIAIDGAPASETRVSGKKLRQVFRRWPWGQAIHPMRIDYSRNGTIPGGYHALADGAKAFDAAGRLVAQAVPIRVVKEAEFVLEVEERHFLGSQGTESYRGLLRFLTNSGRLVGEGAKSGTKQRVVFADWP